MPSVGRNALQVIFEKGKLPTTLPLLSVLVLDGRACPELCSIVFIYSFTTIGLFHHYFSSLFSTFLVYFLFLSFMVFHEMMQQLTLFPLLVQRDWLSLVLLLPIHPPLTRMDFPVSASSKSNAVPGIAYLVRSSGCSSSRIWSRTACTKTHVGEGNCERNRFMNQTVC